MTLSGQRFAVKTLLRYWGFPKSKFPLKGRAKWNVAGEEKILEPGEVVYNPPNLEHSITVLDEELQVVNIKDIVAGWSVKHEKFAI